MMKPKEFIVWCILCYVAGWLSGLLLLFAGCASHDALISRDPEIDADGSGHIRSVTLHSERRTVTAYFIDTNGIRCRYSHSDTIITK